MIFCSLCDSDPVGETNTEFAKHLVEKHKEYIIRLIELSLIAWIPKTDLSEDLN